MRRPIKYSHVTLSLGWPPAGCVLQVLDTGGFRVILDEQRVRNILGRGIARATGEESPELLIYFDPKVGRLWDGEFDIDIRAVQHISIATDSVPMGDSLSLPFVKIDTGDEVFGLLPGHPKELLESVRVRLEKFRVNDRALR